jgi:hypothetical protein
MTSLFAQAPAEVGVPRLHFSSPLRSMLTGLVLAAALVGVMGQLAPAAYADADNSGNFLGALTARGISFTSGPAAIAAGREVCSELDQGKQASDVANEAMAQTNLDGYHAGFFVGASIAAICPRHMH